MRVVVTGAKGQLGQDVVEQLQQGDYTIYALDRESLDITDEQAVQTYMDEVKPDVILHCAAYTNVDQAESDQENAYRVNALGAKYLAKAAQRHNAKILYVSTDYVFNGTATAPYEVDEPTAPLGVYGETKLAGENFVQQITDKHFIVRTAWVFGTKGNNFVKTMIRLGKERGEIGVVHDQVGSPTYTVDLARFMIELMQSEAYGIYHATNEGVCSWYEFAQEIFRQAGMDVKVSPLTTEQFPRPAQRPKYSVLSKKRITSEGFTPFREWQQALAAYLEEAGQKN
ncbi:dTDP-4-dehydrorhamnose reductase [Ectobacillus sp. JY-23]|uniref:dTDP-4-dehydrorhamnose reductase n=1 Tax=Ectobacillus sp. JY-23 TaxID=2933872 RepID=UPI001FF2FC37|nr:dTDP-4-dehydrorhamnose reductase [Ectobacillus sp. JY-23]UOY91308.1 dTDP-4-dehydrorhamnose reductase [Ectobacillus sp. JY-23]